ncbi:MAG TPA: hypothetical protein VJY62_21880, partial [Bacteroidia bacterium]|nr:hypothetical protein [Bacteroidia bacterium]
LRYKTGRANLTRIVLFVGHKFSNNISFFSETEIEDAKVEGGEPGGEISLEQAYLKFDLKKNIYLQAGLFIPRIGIINENHLPTTFNGNDRPFIETLLIPSIWRELGVGLYGSSDKFSGLNYSLAVMNGLNSAAFENGSGIREGRFEGSDATASNLAVSGSLQYFIGNVKMQLSAYYGGSTGLSAREADSLQLNSGIFGTPVALGEFNIQYIKGQFSLRALVSAIQIPDADKINLAYASNTAETMFGGYGEIAYDLLPSKNKKLDFFLRYENFNLNYKIPVNGIENGLLKQQYFVTGFTFIPTAGVAVKLDYVFRKTGDPNPALVVNPFPQAPKYFNTNSFVNIGIGYNF